MTVPELVADGELQPLTDHECELLLGRHHVGRLGLTAASLPVILPINFAMDGSTPVFCTGPGLKLNAARNGHVACLEIDEHDSIEHSGWSVLVIGQLSEVVGSKQLARCERLGLPSWRAPSDPHVLRLDPTLVSGRRLNQIGPLGARP